MEQKIIVTIEITGLGDWDNFVHAHDENEIKKGLSWLEKEIKIELCHSLLDPQNVTVKCELSS